MDRDDLAALSGRPDGWDDITVQPLQSLSATLDREGDSWRAGDPLPPGWQWLYFVPQTPRSQLDADGRSTRDASLTRDAGSKRMFAGGRMKFHRPLRVGERVLRETRLLDRVEKQGRRGPLLIVTVRYTYRGEDGPALEEEQDLLFREGGEVDLPGDARAAIPSARWLGSTRPDAVTLFRFSALTFNGHRIHYDLPYAQREGYPGLVVHGPLLAILLLDLAARNAPGRRLSTFSFRARAPAFVDAPLLLRGDPARDESRAELRAYREDGVVAMTAELSFAPGDAGVPLSRE